MSSVRPVPAPKLTACRISTHYKQGKWSNDGSRLFNTSLFPLYISRKVLCWRIELIIREINTKKERPSVRTVGTAWDFNFLISIFFWIIVFKRRKEHGSDLLLPLRTVNDVIQSINSTFKLFYHIALLFFYSFRLYLFWLVQCFMRQAFCSHIKHVITDITQSCTFIFFFLPIFK